MNKAEWEEFFRDNWISFSEESDGTLATDRRLILSFDEEGDFVEANDED